MPIVLPALVVLSGCRFLVEQRTPPDEVTWSGSVYAEGDTGGLVAFDAGSITVTDTDGQELAEATQSAQGYWEVRVPRDTEVAVRLEGPASDTGGAFPPVVPTVWRGRTPSGRGYWLNGALIAMNALLIEQLLDQIGLLVSSSPTPLSDGSVAVLYGQPWTPSDWAGARLSVTDGSGADAPVVAFTQNGDGTLSIASDGPLDLFIAYDLAPGTVTLTVRAPGRDPVRTTWPARGGDLLSAIYYALPEAQ